MKQTCTVPDCDRHVHGDGLCGPHWKRRARTGSVNPEIPIGKSKNHGLGYHPLYNVWNGMMNRCFDQTNGSYPRYGGRGITVCDRWHTVENFIADMDCRADGETLERIDNDGNYEPSNCRWATRKEQANNTSRNRRITFGDETLTIEEWGKKLGIDRRTIAHRLDGLGWPLEKALTAPPKPKTLTLELINKIFALREIGKSTRAIGREVGVSGPHVCNILNGKYWKGDQNEQNLPRN
jgi:hypothetical protein